MPNEPQYAINLTICESVLIEKNEVPTAVRIVNAIHLSPSAPPYIHFWVITTVVGAENDFGIHTLQVRTLQKRAGTWVEIAVAPSTTFVFGRLVNPQGPGGFNLFTEITLDVSLCGRLETFFVQASLDTGMEMGYMAQTALTLLRG